MKKQLFLTLGIFSMLLLTGCAQKELSIEEKAEIEQEKKDDMRASLNELPKWVLNPEVKGSIAATGIASYNKQGLPVMLTMAEMDGRAKLAGQIETTISQLQEKSLRAVSVEGIDDVENIFTQVTKQVIKQMPVTGAKRVDFYQSKDGTLYVLMAIDNKNVSKKLDEKKSTYKKHMKDANIAKENLDQGMIVLDQMIDKLDAAVE